MARSDEQTPPPAATRRSKRLAGEAPEIVMPARFGPSNSRLLSLPAELRNKIWGYVVGNVNVHLSKEEYVVPEFVSNCASQFDVNELHYMFHHQDPDLQWFGINTEHSHSSASKMNHVCLASHERCEEQSSSWVQNLALLRCNKQVYSEARFMPYSTTNFMFNDPTSFEYFMHEVHRDQLQAIRTITLEIHCSSHIYRNSSCGWARPHIGYWNVLLTPKLLSRLANLEHLNIAFHARFWMPRSYREVEEMDGLALGTLIYFRELRLKTVKVITTCRADPQPGVGADMDDDSHTYADDQQPWDLASRQRHAKLIENLLLNRQAPSFEIPNYEDFQKTFKDLDEADFWDHDCFEGDTDVYGDPTDA